MGVAQDMGGTQPYIPVGADMMNSARARRVIELLGQGMPYKDVADATGITPVHVNRTLRALQAIGTTFQHGTVRVQDWSALKKAGEFDDAYLHLDERPVAEVIRA